MRKLLALPLIALIVAACNAAPINLAATREAATRGAAEALGTIFPSSTPRATLIFPTREPTPQPTRSLVELPSIEITVDAYSITFQPTSCDLQVRPGHVVECGNLIVPENRAVPAGPRVSLPIVIFRSPNYQVAAEPIIFLPDGPGFNAMAALDSTVNQSRALLDNHDYIFYNQRGAPLTSPSLICAGYPDFLKDAYGTDISSADFEEAHIAFLLNCHQQFQDQGIDLSSYNSASNAADLNDLRRVLGYEQINLYGIGYGSKLALSAMRSYPEAIRSAVLDSAYPLEAGPHVENAENAKSAFDIVFQECAADAACAEKYPTLENDFYAVVDQLNATSVPLDFSYGPYVLNGDRFLANISKYFYGAKEIKNVPRAIYLSNRQNFGEITDFLRRSWEVDDLSWGVYFSLQCNEELAFSSREALAAANARVPEQLAGFFGSPWRFDLCASWQSGAADPIENLPVSSSIPTLIFAGHYDLETPPTWGQALTQNLSQSYFYEFPNVGHAVTQSNDCAVEMMLDFLEAPEQAPDAACLASQEAPSFR